MRIRCELSRPSGLLMLRDGASRLLSMRVEYFTLLILRSERKRASRRISAACWCSVSYQFRLNDSQALFWKTSSDLPPSANALCGFGISALPGVRPVARRSGRRARPFGQVRPSGAIRADPSPCESAEGGRSPAASSGPRAPGSAPYPPARAPSAARFPRGSVPFRRTAAICPGAMRSVNSLVLTKVSGQTSRVMSRKKLAFVSQLCFKIFFIRSSCVRINVKLYSLYPSN